MKADRIDRALLVVLVPLVIVAALRALPLGEAFPRVAIEAEIGWILIPAWVALAIGLARRRAIVVGAAIVPALVHAWLVGPALVGAGSAHAAHDGHRLRFVTANVLAFQEREVELARELARLEADVMAIEELTPWWLDVLEHEGVLARFPHRVIEARTDCFGIALLSRYPIVRHEIVEDGGVPRIAATLDVEGEHVRVHAVHTLPPRNAEYTPIWREQMRGLARIAEESEGATILAGDLNASPTSRSYRALVSHRLRGAHELAGRALATTWPNGALSLPIPEMRLDHVLVSPELAVIAVREGTGAGSDHRPVIVDLVVRSAPAIAPGTAPSTSAVSSPPSA